MSGGAVISFNPREASVSQLSFESYPSRLALWPRETSNALLTVLSLQSINTWKTCLSRESWVSMLSLKPRFSLHSGVALLSLVPLGTLSPWDTGWAWGPSGSWFSTLSCFSLVSFGSLHGRSGQPPLSRCALGSLVARQTLVSLRPWDP